MSVTDAAQQYHHPAASVTLALASNNKGTQALIGNEGGIPPLVKLLEVKYAEEGVYEAQRELMDADMLALNSSLGAMPDHVLQSMHSVHFRCMHGRRDARTRPPERSVGQRVETRQARDELLAVRMHVHASETQRIDAHACACVACAMSMSMWR